MKRGWEQLLRFGYALPDELALGIASLFLHVNDDACPIKRDLSFGSRDE